MNIVGASGSAIFVTGSSVAKFEIQFPDWTVNDQKNYYQYSLSAKLQTSYYPPNYNRAGYFPTGSNILAGFSSLINAPNGFVYGIPSSAASVAKYSSTGSGQDIIYISTSSLSTGQPNKFLAAAVSPNGMIYMLPYGSTNNEYYSLFKINTTNDVISNLGNIPGILGRTNYNSAILAPNGFIYGIGGTATAVLKINPNNDSYSTFGNIDTAAGFLVDYGIATLAPNGVIYCPPQDSRFIAKIDTNTDTISFIDIISTATGKYTTSVLAPNNECIYFIPFSATGSLKIDPRTDEITYINVPGFTFNCNSAIVAPDGLIYCFSSTTSTRVVINPFNDTVSTISNSFTSRGATLSVDGAIHTISTSNPRLLKYADNRTYDLDQNFVLSRYRNKTQ